MSLNRFVNVKLMEGELKRTEVRRGIGYRLTTKEFILLREDTSYHIFLDDILGVIEKDEQDNLSTHQERYGDTHVIHQFGGRTFKIVTTKMRIYSRSGVVEKGASTLFTTLSNGFCEHLVTLLQK
jgi:hypothetical protein